MFINYKKIEKAYKTRFALYYSLHALGMSMATPCRKYFPSFNISNMKRATLALGMRVAVE